MINFSLVVQFKDPDFPKWLSCNMYCTSEEDRDSQIGFTVAILSNIDSIARKPNCPIIGIQVNTKNDDVFEAIKIIYKDKFAITRTGTVEISIPNRDEKDNDFCTIV